MKTYAQALDLKEDKDLIAKYENYHKSMFFLKKYDLLFNHS